MGTNITAAQAAGISPPDMEETEKINAFQERRLKKNKVIKAIDAVSFLMWFAVTAMYILYIIDNDVIDDFWYFNFSELFSFMFRTFAYVTFSFIVMQSFFHGLWEIPPELLEPPGFSGILIEKDYEGYAVVLVNNNYIVSDVKINQDITCGMKVIVACFDDDTAVIVPEKEI